MAADQVEVVFLAELLGVGRFVADEFEAADASPFLVNGDDGFVVAEVAQIVDEFAELFGRRDISAEEDVAAGLGGAEEGGGGGVEFHSRNAEEKELTEVS